MTSNKNAFSLDKAGLFSQILSIKSCSYDILISFSDNFFSKFCPSLAHITLPSKPNTPPSFIVLNIYSSVVGTPSSPILKGFCTIRAVIEPSSRPLISSGSASKATTFTLPATPFPLRACATPSAERLLAAKIAFTSGLAVKISSVIAIAFALSLCEYCVCNNCIPLCLAMPSLNPFSL
ncbi:hypothetical protein SDC9_133345 [bioreactor metagenome]|uniref:Uncharacterized protein n=1 Tax=bioreactor metagenome TaxID=1076179 RepID=A0A645DA13_9ZZZZ